MSKLKARQPAEVKPRHTKALIFGPSGVGKTTFALSFPTPYFIDTEGGAELAHYQKRLGESGGAYLGPQDGANDPAVVIDQMRALATERHPYRTLIVDSITKIYQTIIANEAERLGTKDAFGASKKPAVGFMRQIIVWTDKLDMNVLFNAHDAAEWGLVGGERKEIGRCPDVWDKLIFELDLGFQFLKQGPSRYLLVRKSRLLGFPEGERLPAEYSEFAQRYGKDFLEAEAVPVTLATPAQIAELRWLLDTIKLEEGTIEKWLDRAQVASFEEMGGDMVAKCIVFCQSKLNQTK